MGVERESVLRLIIAHPWGERRRQPGHGEVITGRIHQCVDYRVAAILESGSANWRDGGIDGKRQGSAESTYVPGSISSRCSQTMRPVAECSKRIAPSAI